MSFYSKLKIIISFILSQLIIFAIVHYHIENEFRAAWENSIDTPGIFMYAFLFWITILSIVISIIPSIIFTINHKLKKCWMDILKLSMYHFTLVYIVIIMLSVISMIVFYNFLFFLKGPLMNIAVLSTLAIFIAGWIVLPKAEMSHTVL